METGGAERSYLSATSRLHYILHAGEQEGKRGCYDMVLTTLAICFFSKPWRISRVGASLPPSGEVRYIKLSWAAACSRFFLLYFLSPSWRELVCDRFLFS